MKRQTFYSPMLLAFSMLVSDASACEWFLRHQFGCRCFCINTYSAPPFFQPLPAAATLPPARPEFDLSSLKSGPLNNQQVNWDAAYCMSLMSDLAYAEDTVADSQLKAWGLSSQKVAVGKSEVRIAWDDDVIIIACRGTDPLEAADWIADLDVLWIVLSQGRMHKGFYGYYDKLHSGVTDAMPSPAEPKRRVWITGHSLGGAMAVVCGYRLRQKRIEVNATVTFGQPMLADEEMAAFLGEQTTGRYLRIVNDRDVVPTVPPSFRRWNYTHFGKQAWFRADGVDILGRPVHAAQPGPVIGDAAFLPGQRPLTGPEFRHLKRVANERRRQISEVHGPTATAQFSDSSGFLPMFADHAIANYIAKTREQMILARSIPARR